MMSSLVLWFKTKMLVRVVLRAVCVVTAMYFWWRDCVRESLVQGSHSMAVVFSLKLGMILFIFSEVLFFLAFFWTFIHCSLSVVPDIGLVWPPIHIEGLRPFQVPVLNTLVLLSSGVTVTAAHYSKIVGSPAQFYMLWTIVLGVYFTLLQLFEYLNSSFRFRDSSIGRVFFLATGFHGVHVIIGTRFLVIQLFRMVSNQFTSFHHLGFELSIWYWHFVDVVWLFLFSLVYWWGL